MVDPQILDDQPIREDALKTDSEQKLFKYDVGGVPWFLLLLYLGFLVFFTRYVLDFQLPDFLVQGPGKGGEQSMVSK